MVAGFSLREKPIGSVTAIYARAPTAGPLTLPVVPVSAVIGRVRAAAPKLCAPGGRADIRKVKCLDGRRSWLSWAASAADAGLAG